MEEELGLGELLLCLAKYSTNAKKLGSGPHNLLGLITNGYLYTN